MNFKLEYTCPLRWDAQSAAEGGDFCQTCQEPVHNLSELCEAEVDALFGDPQQPACGQMTVNHRGQIRLKAGWSSRLLLGLGLAAAAGCDSDESATTSPEIHEVQTMQTAGLMVPVATTSSPCEAEGPLPSEECPPDTTQLEGEDQAGPAEEAGSQKSLESKTSGEPSHP